MKRDSLRGGFISISARPGPMPLSCRKGIAQEVLARPRRAVASWYLGEDTRCSSQFVDESLFLCPGMGQHQLGVLAALGHMIVY
jgi:hypothetical protein